MSSAVLVTGARGFIGKNLVLALRRRPDLDILEFDVQDDNAALHAMTARADLVFHLAGVNRPRDADEFREGNTELTRLLCRMLHDAGRSATLVVSSTIQAALDNPYGVSKKHAEDAAFAYAAGAGAHVHVFRLHNVFGKWCRPNYNSVVATFCHNISRGLPVQVNDPARVLDLIYIDDLVRGFLAVLDGRRPQKDGAFNFITPVHRISLGALEKLLLDFAASRNTLVVPDMSDPLTRAMYATYCSYLPEDAFAFGLTKREDARGALAEVLKSPHAGQLFFSTTKPGVTRGNHFHDSKVEKFIVLSGEATIRFEHVLTGARIDVPVSGTDMKIVDIPPGYTHHIENTGSGELVVLFWANELFDKDAPDTFFQEVRRG